MSALVLWYLAVSVAGKKTCTAHAILFHFEASLIIFSHVFADVYKFSKLLLQILNSN